MLTLGHRDDWVLNGSRSPKRYGLGTYDIYRHLTPFESRILSYTVLHEFLPYPLFPGSLLRTNSGCQWPPGPLRSHPRGSRQRPFVTSIARVELSDAGGLERRMRGVDGRMRGVCRMSPSWDTGPSAMCVEPGFLTEPTQLCWAHGNLRRHDHELTDLGILGAYGARR